MRWLISLLVVVSLLAGCQGREGEGSSIPSGAEAGAISDPPYPPPLIAFQRFEKTADGYHNAVFKVTNLSREAVYYFGYEHFAFFGGAVLRDGRWEDAGAGYCGTGAAYHPLAAGESREFGFWTGERGEAVCVCLNFYSVPDWRGGILVWSAPVSIPWRR